MMRTKRDFERFFRAEILPAVRERFEQDGRVDIPARREAWNDLTDAMVQDRKLPKRALEWDCPW